MNDKITEYRKNHPRCRYCKYARQNSFNWKCLAKQKTYSENLSDTRLKGMFCGLFEVKED